MSQKRWQYWGLRVLAVLFILFISLFAFDVFGEYETVWETLLALFMHLIPSFLLIIVTVIAWRWRVSGGMLFVLLGLVSIVFFRTYVDVIVFLLISLPPMVLGIFFVLESQWYPPNKQHNT